MLRRNQAKQVWTAWPQKPLPVQMTKGRTTHGMLQGCPLQVWLLWQRKEECQMWFSAASLHRVHPPPLSSLGTWAESLQDRVVGICQREEGDRPGDKTFAKRKHLKNKLNCRIQIPWKAETLEHIVNFKASTVNVLHEIRDLVSNVKQEQEGIQRHQVLRRTCGNKKTQE
jgi:hypothetical protein